MAVSRVVFLVACACALLTLLGGATVAGSPVSNALLRRRLGGGALQPSQHVLTETSSDVSDPTSAAASAAAPAPAPAVAARKRDQMPIPVPTPAPAIPARRRDTPVVDQLAAAQRTLTEKQAIELQSSQALAQETKKQPVTRADVTALEAASMKFVLAQRARQVAQLAYSGVRVAGSDVAKVNAAIQSAAMVGVVLTQLHAAADKLLAAKASFDRAKDKVDAAGRSVRPSILSDSALAASTLQAAEKDMITAQKAFSTAVGEAFTQPPEPVLQRYNAEDAATTREIAASVRMLAGARGQAGNSADQIVSKEAELRAKYDISAADKAKMTPAVLAAALEARKNDPFYQSIEASIAIEVAKMQMDRAMMQQGISSTGRWWLGLVPNLVLDSTNKVVSMPYALSAPAHHIVECIKAGNTAAECTSRAVREYGATAVAAAAAAVNAVAPGAGAAVSAAGNAGLAMANAAAAGKSASAVLSAGAASAARSGVSAAVGAVSPF